MFIIGPGLGSYGDLKDAIISDVDTIYEETTEKHRASDVQAEERVYAYVDQIIAATPTSGELKV